MQIHVHEEAGKGIGSLRIEHAGETMIVAGGSYQSAAIIGREVMFKETNDFIAALAQEEQDRLWELYSKANEYLSDEETRSSFLIRSRIESIVKEIYQIVTYPALREYVDRARLIIPGDVSEKFEEFSERGRNYRSRTYIRSDYIDMVAMALGLRFMIPIWGTYTQNVASINSNAYKESEVVKLVELAGMADWPPYKRMLEYVEASIDREASAASVIAGLSSEEIPRFLMSMALVRKISIGPLSTSVEKDSLPLILKNNQTATYMRMDGRFQSMTGIIQHKRHRAVDKKDEDNSSVWDDYSQATEITEGDRQVLEAFAEREELTIQRICPDLDLSRVQQCISICSRNEQRKIEWFQKALIFWVFRTISPEARELLQKLILLRMMGTVQAILDHWGFHELAILVSAEEYIDEDGDTFMPVETRNKITKQQLEILDRQYPHYRQETKRQDPGKRNNVAVLAIDQVVEKMSGRSWKPNAPRDIIERIPMLGQAGYMYISGDIKRQLADMIIHTNTILGSKHETA